MIITSSHCSCLLSLLNNDVLMEIFSYLPVKDRIISERGMYALTDASCSYTSAFVEVFVILT